ncbi:MAG: hypothetical protein NXI31_03725 [bacterium]|nr:hypothetical protein [bacterium]
MTDAAEDLPAVSPFQRLRVVLPIVWGLGCVLGAASPGDEYALFGMGSAVGTWIVFVVPFERPESAILPVLVVGCGLMFAAGLALDRLRMSTWAWWPVYAVVAIAVYLQSVGQFASFEAAVRKHGSGVAYLAFSAQVGHAAATALALLVGAARYFLGLWRRNAGSVASIG